MKGQKKYCLNVSSYKYKRECMKLFSTTLKAFNTFNNNEIIESQNLCPGGKRCKNYGIILNLEQKIKALNDTVNQLTKINEYSNESNLNKNITPTKSIEPKRHDSFNEICNSFRNSVKKKKFRENNRSLTGSITFLQQISEPYRIKPYNSISTEAKIPNRKIINKKHIINLDINNIKNYKNKYYNNSEKNDLNEEYFLNKRENLNINIEQKNNEDKFDNNKIKNKIEDDKNKFQKLFSSISEYYNNKDTDKDKDKLNKNLNNNINNIDTDEKNNSKKQKKEEKEIKNKKENNENINQKNNIKDNDKIKNKSFNLNYNKETTKKTVENINIPIVKKVKTYKLIAPLKAGKNMRYDYDLLDNKINIKDENKNKLYFRKFKGKINSNSFNSSNNRFLSRSSGIRNNTEGNESLFNLVNKNSKTLSYQNRFNKIKINSFNNFRPLSLTQKPFKIKMTINQNDLFRNKNKNNEKIKNDNDIDSNISNSFIKELEYKNDENEEKNDKNKIFNEIYNLASSKAEEIIDKVKNLSIEKIDKYSSFIIKSLKYIKDSIEIMHKLKIFYNFINSKNKINYFNDNKKEILINEEFINYREKVIKLLNCENIHIFVYDPISDYLILKGEKEEIKYEKDKDLIGLSFTSGKKVRYESDNNSPIPLPKLLGDNKLSKIKNLLIYPLKDSNNNIYGIIEVINKIQDKDNNNLYNNNFYLKEKISFNKNDEIIISFISKDLGNFCKYYNYIKNNNIYIDYYHKIYNFAQKLFLKNNDKENNSNFLYFINEVIDLSKNIFEMNDIQFLKTNKDHFYDIQKNKKIPFDGLVYKCYNEKKINYTSKPLINKFYSIKSDLAINIFNMSKNEELITIPIIEIKSNDVIMIIQIKTNKKLGNYLSLGNDKLSDEIFLIIENISFIIQKYLSENNELI